jgi:hypothetical protein
VRERGSPAAAEIEKEEPGEAERDPEAAEYKIVDRTVKLGRDSGNDDLDFLGDGALFPGRE